LPARARTATAQSPSLSPATRIPRPVTCFIAGRPGTRP
jgi:hypothetical protein